jgi:hypothetical protein
MTITRLTGGLTPADGSDPRTFPTIWNSTADDLERGFRLVETVYFTSSGTFTKASYPWLRAIRVKVQGAGGGSGGVGTTSAGQFNIAGGGAGGGYAESFITDIAGLDASVTVTRGAGGSGGAAGNNAGSAGGDSSFGSLVVGGGGDGGAAGAALTAPGHGTASGSSSTQTLIGDFTVFGGNGSAGVGFANSVVRAFGGGSFMAPTRIPPGRSTTGQTGLSGELYGSGSTSAINAENQSTTRSGGNGGNGIVIVELYA